MALGAGRKRLMSRFLVEGILVSMLGGVMGLLLAYTLLKLFTAFTPIRLPEGVEVVMDYRLLLFCLAATLLTGLISGSAPAWAGIKAKLERVSQGTRSKPHGWHPPAAVAWRSRNRGNG